jgi:hypothetical protein
MAPELILALLSGAVALISAGIAVWGSARTARIAGQQQRQAAELAHLRSLEERRAESERVVSRFREPLARAAYDLQSRLYNILCLDLIDRFLVEGDAAEAGYVVDNTAFVIAQYFSWTEITRNEIQFIDLGKDEDTRRLSELQDQIYTLWNTDELGKTFRVFAGEQRAIGEILTETDSGKPRCLGYGAFLARFPRGTSPLIDSLRDDVTGLAQNLDQARSRLLGLQHSLIALLDFLDPDCIRFPRSSRTRAQADARRP